MEEQNILKIYKYGDDVLKLKANEIENIDEAVVKLKDRMVATMHSMGNAIGLAAPQVGESLQLSVIDLSQGQDPDQLLVLLNPEILELEGSDVDEEGCLSFPGITVPVKRALKIFLKNRDFDGNEHKTEIEGYLARVIQHEIDHLFGTLIIDHASPLKRQVVKKEIRRLKKNDEW